ncbi:PucR family transcriptional regulator [Thermocrispum agreste]|uniref:PucR family transcriptional regulator n=1 Tax=Thermocrispum agreste TaxID=37925 RepID=UPI0004127BE7|nr:PucR family transcriptional regulator [Thermocrispum agreste]
MTRSHTDTQAAAVEFITAHRRNRLESLTDRLVKAIESENPGYQDTIRVPHDDLRRSCHDNIDRVLQLLAEAVSGRPTRPHADAIFDAARQTGHRRAEQGVPLDDVLRSFRFGGRIIWDDLIEHGRDVLPPEVVPEIGTRLWEVVDQTSAEVASAYHHYERSVLRADERRRAMLWEGVLSGRTGQPGFIAEASRVLDLPVEDDYLVIVCDELDIPLAESRLAAHPSAWVDRSDVVVGVIALREPRADQPLELLHGLAAAPPGRLIGVSGVVRGLAGVADGYRQALLALRARAGSRGLSRYDDCLPEALLLSSPDIADDLIRTWLDPLLALPAAEARELIRTLRAWVACAGSTVRTAKAVPCHRNTVVNRLRRIALLIGRPLAEDTPPVELDLALRALAMRSGR